MEHNPYQAPQADSLVATPEAAGGGGYYVVAKGKFLLLFIVTMGLYAVYWSYRNWAAQKQRKRLAIWPVMRGIFLIFFVHALVDRMHEDARPAAIRLAPGLRTYATVIVLLMIVGRILDRAVSKNLGFPWLDLLSFLLIPVLGWVTWLLQAQINLVAGDASGSSNRRLGAGNIVWLVLFGLFWLLALFGYAMSLVHPELMAGDGS